MKPFRVVLGLLLAGAVVALLLRHRGAASTRVRVVDLPAGGEVFASPLGRVLVQSASDGRARFHRHAHAVWMPLDDAEARWSQAGKWTRARVPAGELLYTPPYATFAWTRGGLLLGFVAAPEDEPAYVDDGESGLRDAADAVRIDRAGKWMLDKLEIVRVTATRKLGPFARDAAIYVVSGGGELDARPVAAKQLARVPAEISVEVVASSPLTLVVFDPAHTTVSSILKQGTKRYSQDDEELVIRDFFRDRTNGFFVDVGAGHYQRYSTTFFLEEQLGWSGVAIDALSEWADDYRKHRKRTTFVNALITDKERGPQPFYRADDFPEVSAVSKQLAEEQAKEFSDSGAVSERTVPSSTLDEVLDRRRVNAIDFLSMDIEEHEPAALAGFDIDRFRPAFVCIEAHPAVRDALWQYFRRHGYVRQDQYLAWDFSNWYFARP